MARYGNLAQQKVKKVMEERKKGTLRSGSSGKKVTSRKQAIAIGLSEARRAGGKVPKQRRRSARLIRAVLLLPPTPAWSRRGDSRPTRVLLRPAAIHPWRSTASHGQRSFPLLHRVAHRALNTL
jgi:hypothetical protein